MATVKKIVQITLGVTIGVAIMLAGVFAMLYGVFATASPVTLAFGGTVAIIIWVVTTALNRLDTHLLFKQFNGMKPGTPPATIEMPRAAPRQFALPPPDPIRKTLPAMRIAGEYYPHGLAEEEQRRENNPVILDTSLEGESLSAPVSILYKFAALPTPTRSEGWVGDTEGYTLASKWFYAQGFLHNFRNGYRWKEQYPMNKRVAWLEQIELESLESPNNRR